MLSMRWFYENGNSFTDFAQIMIEQKDDEVFSSELVQITLKHFWKT